MARKKQKNLAHIGNILSDSFSNIRAGNDSDVARVWVLWRSAVGENIAKNTRPASFKGSLLIINVSNSVWLQHLTFLKAELIDKINSALGDEKIKELKFKIGDIEPPTKDGYSANEKCW